VRGSSAIARALELGGENFSLDVREGMTVGQKHYRVLGRTGNTFGKNVSNVTRLVKLLAHHKEQVVVYDQGIGTSASRLKAVEDYRKSVCGQDALQILEGPREWWFKPAGWLTIVLGLLGGWGLKANVRQMYCRLSALYEGPDDKVFLFGFSRGAFTIRALAALIYRCGLPGKTATDMGERIDKAWKLYKPLHKDNVAIRAFMSSGFYRDVRLDRNRNDLSRNVWCDFYNSGDDS
jgi:uncharacterized protein (DUF2235 family)